MVAMIEILSPGNKNTAHAFRSFVQTPNKLVGPGDPNGIHAADWNDIAAEPFAIPHSKPLTLIAYEVEYDINAYVETIAVGDSLPDMPLFPRARPAHPRPTEEDPSGGAGNSSRTLAMDDRRSAVNATATELEWRGGGSHAAPRSLPPADHPLRLVGIPPRHVAGCDGAAT
ncbi:MAG: hypothetical protein ACOVT5_07920, partial [Armatimonadaceae bacterium]